MATRSNRHTFTDGDPGVDHRIGANDHVLLDGHLRDKVVAEFPGHGGIGQKRPPEVVGARDDPATGAEAREVVEGELASPDDAHKARQVREPADRASLAGIQKNEIVEYFEE